MQSFKLVYSLCWCQAQMNDYVRKVWCEVSVKSNVKNSYFHLGAAESFLFACIVNRKMHI